ncbi:acyltransferase family protein [Ensifer sp. T173]|uniref:Acyltransferase family protein n=1 Tax=Ensifer canadensis TaxID=555315 RepID=A0AAW4FSN2_9HYPH|nr:acyltransferase family protein [Ensifer canadensis]MBM3094319.1 acyltransferase family protein [Ensifer canadensis]UBI80540.1 acyltransferase [Ensifer canadensis]
MAVSQHHNGYRPDLDGLRAVAILPVLLFHAGFEVFRGGFVGVDVFFVLSGFFMARIILGDLERGSFSFVEFYLRRARRIFPALFVMMAASALAAWLLFMPQEFEYFASSLSSSALFVSNVLFQRESGYFDIASDLKPLLHTWSLSVEEQFYIVFPAAAYISYKYARKRILWVVFAALTMSFVLSVFEVYHKPEKAFYLLHFRVWELLIGVVVALSPRPCYSARTSQALTAIGLLLVFGAAFLYSSNTPFPGIAAAVPCVGTALVIHSHCTSGWIARFLDNPVCIFVGRISYSLYLWHWPLIVFSRNYLGSDLTTEQALIVVALSFATAYLSWRFVEQPARYGRLAISGAATAGLSSVAIASAIAFGILVNSLNGVPQRLPEEARRLYEATYDDGPFIAAECFADSNGNGLTPVQIRKGELCTLGVETKSEPQFLVWGDSHAAAIAPAIDVAAREAGLSGMFVGRGSCPPLPNSDFGPSWAVKRCVEHNSAVMALIQQRKFPYVFMVGYWPKYVHRAELPRQGGVFDPSIEPSTVDWSAPVRESLNTTIATFTQQGTKTVLVMDVPEMGHEVPEALAQAVVSGSTLDVAPPLEYTHKRQALARKVLEEVAKSSGSLVVDPLSTLCDKFRCHAMRGATVLYKDEDHLSAKGAESLAAVFRPVLNVIEAKEQSSNRLPRS